MEHARLYLCGGCVPDWLTRSLYRGVTVTLSLILLQPRSEKFQQVPVTHCNIYLQIEYIVDRRLWRTPPPAPIICVESFLFYILTYMVIGYTG